MLARPHLIFQNRGEILARMRTGDDEPGILEYTMALAQLQVVLAIIKLQMRLAHHLLHSLLLPKQLVSQASRASTMHRLLQAYHAARGVLCKSMLQHALLLITLQLSIHHTEAMRSEQVFRGILIV